MVNWLIAGVFLIFLSVILVFFNGSWAFLTFILSWVVLVIWYNHPESKVVRARLDAEAKAVRDRKDAEAKAIRDRQEAIAEQSKFAHAMAMEELAKKFQQLSENPIDTQALDYVLDSLRYLSEEDINPIIRSIVLPLLKIKPLDERVRATVLYCAQSLSIQAPSRAFYDAALDILQQHPEQVSLKKYALEFGRWHHSLGNPDGNFTTDDEEQAIQNDILVRSR